jgi:TolB-like protein/class 3 adenylate cyclase/tetratricopeptide (TPR) repeat protein
MSSSRQLAAILFTDIAGYTAMMQEDEAGALRVVRHYSSVLRDSVARYQGTIVNDYGDGNLCTFTSVTEAVRCAVELQRELQAEPKVPLRVGLHVGEIFFEDGKVFGDGVNVASRIQSLGVANSVLFSSEIHSKISNQSEFKAVSLGSFHFKNVSAPMEVFALANDGLVVPARDTMEGKLKAHTSPMKKWIAAGTVVLLVVAASFLYTKLHNQPDSDGLRKSVAVLAFEDMSPNKDQEWFSDGISEEIINSLANLKELKVMARTSSFYFKGKDMPLTEIAEKLGVDHLVEGSVQRIDDRLRITVQLVTKEGFHLLSETYDRPATDLFDVRSEIAESIAGKLLIKLSPEIDRRIRVDKPSSVEAYEYYLRGKSQLLSGFNGTGWPADRHQEEFLLRAIALDPDFAPAYGLLAELYDTRGMRGRIPSDRVKAWLLRDSLVRIGLALNPTSPEILIAKGLTFIKSVKPTLDSAHYFLKTAFSLYPTDGHVNFTIGAFYTRIGMEDIANDFFNRSIALDPLNLAPRIWLAQNQERVGDYENAALGFRKIIDLQPTFARLYRYLAGTYVLKNELGKAANELAKAERLDSIRNSIQGAMMVAAQGKKAEALKVGGWDIRILSLLKMNRETLGRLDSLASHPVVIEPIGFVAIRMFQSNVDVIFGTCRSLEKNPIFDFVRGEPEFKRIYARKKKEFDENMKKYGSLD